jgi:hypothetical protein
MREKGSEKEEGRTKDERNQEEIWKRKEGEKVKKF